MHGINADIGAHIGQLLGLLRRHHGQRVIDMADLNAFHAHFHRFSDHGEALRCALMAQAEHHVRFRYQFQDSLHLRHNISFIIDDGNTAAFGVAGHTAMVGGVHVGQPDEFATHPVAGHDRIGVQSTDGVIEHHAAKDFRPFLVVCLRPFIHDYLGELHGGRRRQGMVLADNARLPHLTGLAGELNLAEKALGGG